MFMRGAHPGAVLGEELGGIGFIPTEFARRIDAPPNRVSRIITREHHSA